MANDLFFITDGTEYINLRDRYSGLFLQAWQPGIKDAKGGGVWQDSPMSDGRVLVDRPFANATEQLSLIVGAGGQDETIYAAQTIRRLLQKAVNYSLTEWQAGPVWIVARARYETNVRYAIIYDYRAPGEGNPFADPFDGDWPITPFPLLLERGDWMSNPPGEGECLPISTLLEIGEEVFYSPSESTDDAYINLSFIYTDSEEIRVGNQLSQSLRAGIRFQGVAIPQGSTILSANLRLTVNGVATGTVCNVKIRAEDSDSAAAFSDLSDFTSRAETSAGVDWDNLGAYGLGDLVSTPNISAVIQEVIDRAGWVSGNDLVLFLDDNGSDIDAYRRFGTFDGKTYAVPVLEINFSSGNVIASTGQESTCENANFVGNRRSGILTHAWYFDASTPIYSSNLLGLTLPYALLPSTPAANDILYFMSETNNALSAPIGGLVFDLSTPMSGVSGVWEYYNGGAWQTLQAAFTPNYGSQPLESEGINSIHARQPADMTTVLINSVTGWAVRFRVTSVSSPVAPVQQNRHPYTIGNNDLLIETGDLGGDLPPLLNLVLHNRADNTGGLATVPIPVGRVIMGMRQVIRGGDFIAAINLADKYNPSGITLGAGSNTSAGDDPQAPTGRVYIFNPAGAASITQRLAIVFTNLFSQNYKGVFKPFLRVKQVGGSAGDMGVRLRIGILSASNIIYTSDTLYTTVVDEFEILEFREVTLPPNLDAIKTNEAIAGIIIAIDALNTNATPPDLHLVDLFLMPVDEYSLDVYDTLQTAESSLANTDTNRQLELDSAYRLKRQASALLELEQGPIPILDWAINANGPLVLQPSNDQRLYFLFAHANGNNGWNSYPENAVSIQAFIQKRYFSMRGNR